MNDLVISAWPREDVLGSRRLEFSRLSEALADRELALAQFRAALVKFEIRYYQAVGRRYVELDELQARLSQEKWQRAPDDEASRSEAWFRRFCADRSAWQFHEFEDRTTTADPPADNGAGEPDEEMKKLFRMVAVQIHPDRAAGEDTRAVRTALMAELNAAYAAGDTGRMRAILEEWRTSPESVEGDGRAAESLRLTRAIARLKRRIEKIETEMAWLQRSEMGRLFAAAQESATRGRDLLVDLAADVEGKIARVRRELEEILEEVH